MVFWGKMLALNESNMVDSDSKTSGQVEIIAVR